MEGPYVRELDRKGRGLSFENARLEAEYQAYAAGRHASDLRSQLLIGGLMIAVLCLFDFLLLDTGFAGVAALLRLGIMLPLVLLMAMLTQRRGGRRHLQAAGVVVALTVGLTSLWIAEVGQRYDAPGTFAGYQVLTVFVYFFLGLRVPVAAATGFVLLAAYVAAALVNGASAVAVAYDALFLIFLNVVGALGSYQMSQARRTVFLEERILSYRANHDALTNLPNRRAFDALLDTAWENAREMARPLALLMIDIDHFKNYNDRYGHQAGDHAIAAVASILEASLQRPQDFAGRYGGEEFVVLLFDSTTDYARDLADKIRRQVLARNIEHAGSGAARCVSVSIGLAHLEHWRGDRSIHGFVQMADEALYAAKEQGRNRVVEANGMLASTTTGLFRVMKADKDADDSGPAGPVAET